MPITSWADAINITLTSAPTASKFSFTTYNGAAAGATVYFTWVAIEYS